MEIAKIENGNVAALGDYRTLFPEISFPSSGPDDQWLTDNGCKKVNRWKSFDAATEQLVPAAPYAEGDWVYVVSVQSLTTEELAARTAAQEAAAKAANVAKAKRELEESDWCENASVRNSAVLPHLTNATDFDTYRLALRMIVVTEPNTVENWPVRPEATWVTE